MRSKSAISFSIGCLMTCAAFAADKASVDQATSTFSRCLSTVSSASQAASAIKKEGYELGGTNNGMQTFFATDRSSMISASDKTNPDPTCVVSVDGLGLKRANAIAGAYAKQLGAEPSSVDDSRASKRWVGTYKNKNVAVVTIKEINAGFFKAPSITVVMWD